MKSDAAAAAWVTRVIMTLAAAAALSLAFELGEMHQRNHQPVIATPVSASSSPSVRALIAERDYYQSENALGLRYFNALRAECLPVKRSKP